MKDANHRPATVITALEDGIACGCNSRSVATLRGSAFRHGLDRQRVVMPNRSNF
jgi:hypothetical protein